MGIEPTTSRNNFKTLTTSTRVRTRNAWKYPKLRKPNVTKGCVWVDERAERPSKDQKYPNLPNLTLSGVCELIKGYNNKN